MKTNYYILIFFFYSFTLHAQCTKDFAFYRFDNTKAETEWQIQANTPFEIGIQRGKNCNEILNFYNTEEILYYAEIQKTEGEKLNSTFYAYYYQQFADTLYEGFSVKWKPVSTPHPFRIRLAIEETGSYQVVIFERYQSGTSKEVARKALKVNKSEPEKHGFLSFSPVSRRYLQYSDSTPFFAIGEKMSYYRDLPYLPKIKGIEPQIHYSPRTLQEYFRCIDEMIKNGGNYISIIFCPWSFDVEGRETQKLGDYSPYQKRLSDLDALLLFCEQKGVHVQLSLIDHAMLEFFGVSPYRKLIQPALEKKIDFFTDISTQKFIEQKIHYLNARYGQLPVVSAFEVFSETESCGNDDINDTLSRGLWKCPNPEDGGKSSINCNALYWNENNANSINRWILDRAAYLRRLNPRIPITNAIGDVSLWRIQPYNNISRFSDNPEGEKAFSFLSIHAYFAFRSGEYLKNLLLQVYTTDSMPVQLGETGWGSAAEGCPTREITDNDMHNMLWASSFSGAFGTGLDWWWQDYTHSRAPWIKDFDKGYKHFKPISLFWEAENLTKTYWKPVATPVVWDSLGKEKWNFDKIFRYPEKANGIFFKSDLSLMNHALRVSDSVGIEAFALKSDTKWLGWVHHKDHFLRNLPRDKKNDSKECEEVYQKNPPPDKINPIQNATLSLLSVRCNGRYKVTWWSPYYSLSDTNVTTVAEGELNNPAFYNFQNQEFSTQNGILSLTLPPLQAYDFSGKSPYLPDYAFKIVLTKPAITENWQDKDFNGKWKIAKVSVSEDGLTPLAPPVIQKRKTENKSNATYLIGPKGEIALPSPPQRKVNPIMDSEKGYACFVGKDGFLYISPHPDSLFEKIKLPPDIQIKKGSPLLFHQQQLWFLDEKGYPVTMKKLNQSWISAPLVQSKFRENSAKVLPALAKSPLIPSNQGVIFQAKDKQYYLLYLFNPCSCESQE